MLNPLLLDTKYYNLQYTMHVTYYACILVIICYMCYILISYIKMSEDIV